MKKCLGLLIFSLFITTSLYAQILRRESVALTIYKKNLGVVRESLSLASHLGSYDITLNDVSDLIDPSTINLNLPVDVLELNYCREEERLQNKLQKYIDKEITLVGPTTVRGTLLSTFPANVDSCAGQVLIRNTEGGITALNNPDGYQISDSSRLHQSTTKPSIRWRIRGRREGNEQAELSYMTEGFDWYASYVATLDKAEEYISLNSIVTINNKSGADYENAQLTLVDADVYRIYQRYEHDEDLLESMPQLKMLYAPKFSNDKFFKYHTYALDRPTTVLNNEITQIELLETRKARVTKKIIYSKGEHVYEAISFQNIKSNNLGIALPAGVVKVFKDSGKVDQNFETSMIPHTPIGGEIDLMTGIAADLQAKENKTSDKHFDFAIDYYNYEIIFTNHGIEDVVIEVIRDIDIKGIIVSASEKYEMQVGHKARFSIRVPKGSESKLTYRVRESI